VKKIKEQYLKVSPRMKYLLFSVFTIFSLICGSVSSKGQVIFSGDNLSGTELMLSEEVKNFRSEMIMGMYGYFKQASRSCLQSRETHWNRNYSSPVAYSESIEPNRNRFKKIIGVIGEREPLEGLTLVETTFMKSLVAETGYYSIFNVSWPVLEGITGTGLWIEPHSEAKAQIVVLPDADQTPEMLMGLTPEVSQKMVNEFDSRESLIKSRERKFYKSEEIQFARRFAEAGCRVIIPVLINREARWSGTPGVRMTNQSHREFIYRRAYEVGRHIIGYEVQKVLAAVDWFEQKSPGLPVAVAGYGEGGLIAFYSTAVDSRIKGALVSGYFREREDVWQEPIYRNVWGLLEEFGDAGVAGLIVPRMLIIEASKGPEVIGAPDPQDNQRDVAAPGVLMTPPLESVKKEAEKAEIIFTKLGYADNLKVIISGNGEGHPGTAEATEKLLTGIGVGSGKAEYEDGLITDRRIGFDPELRMRDQFDELLGHLDEVIEQSPKQREKFWSRAVPSSIDSWEETTQSYREYFHNELIGSMPEPSEPFNPSTRLTYETPDWRGYWVKLDVWPEIIAGGILLIPKDINPGEKRPVVVFQHGLGGLPEPLVDPGIESAYHSFGSKLAEQGFIVYAPQNPYGLLIEEPNNQKIFRIVQRMANPLKQSLFSVIIGQHKQTLKWLRQLPFVDEKRIGFYGLSYGGKTAMRVPPVLKDYSVVICSGDFNEWVWKNTSLHFPASYMFVHEYEIFEFNLANTFNYAEMAGLIAPRPFMVERGHRDGVAPDEWVAYEYAKVRRLYDRLGIGDRTTIEFFNGPHEIHGVGTMKFLNKHLRGYENSNK
jgi:dienelactone hydrolase